MYGVDAREWEEGGLVWLLTGRLVDVYKLSFVRSTKRLLRGLRARYGLLFNLVDARYEQALGWLFALGFRIGPPMAHPTTGAPFRLATVGG